MEKKEIAKQVAKDLQELNSLEKIEDLIKNDTIEFTHKEVKYRVRKPTYKEREAVRKERSKKFLQLLQDDSFMLKEQLVALYRKKGVDITSMEKEIGKLQRQIEKLQLRLVPEADENSRQKLTDEIASLSDEQSKINMKITDLLSHSLELELLEFSNLYTAYLSLEKEVKEEDKVNWITAYKTYEEYLNADEAIVGESVKYLSLLIFQINLDDLR